MQVRDVTDIGIGLIFLVTVYFILERLMRGPR